MPDSPVPGPSAVSVSCAVRLPLLPSTCCGIKSRVRAPTISPLRPFPPPTLSPVTAVCIPQYVYIRISFVHLRTACPCGDVCTSRTHATALSPYSVPCKYAAISAWVMTPSPSVSSLAIRSDAARFAEAAERPRRSIGGEALDMLTAEAEEEEEEGLAAPNDARAALRWMATCCLRRAKCPGLSCNS